MPLVLKIARKSRASLVGEEWNERMKRYSACFQYSRGSISVDSHRPGSRTYLLCGAVACLTCLAGLVLDHWWPFSDTLLLWPIAAKKSKVQATVSTSSETIIMRVVKGIWMTLFFPREMWSVFFFLVNVILLAAVTVIAQNNFAWNETEMNI